LHEEKRGSEADPAGDRNVGRGQVYRAPDAGGYRLGGRRQSPADIARPSPLHPAFQGRGQGPAAAGDRRRYPHARLPRRKGDRADQDAGERLFLPIESLFLDCAGAELLRRYSETRRRHPLALDRPAIDGIAEERELLAPLRRWSDYIIDTTDSDSPALQHQIRERFGTAGHAPNLHIMSFGFARGLPRNADTVFDLRFLKNPHWVDELRRSPARAAGRRLYRHRRGYEAAVGKIEDLLVTLLPATRRGKILSLHRIWLYRRAPPLGPRLERVASRLREAGFSPTVEHRDLGSRPARRDRGRRRGTGRKSNQGARMIGLVLVTHGRLALRVHHCHGACRRAAAADRGDLHRPRGRHGSRRNDIAEAIARSMKARSDHLTICSAARPPTRNLADDTDKVEVIAGVNLPMLIRLEGARKTMDVKTAVAAAREAGGNISRSPPEILGEAA
jgi:UPF0042 nucleotide-binding protein